MDVFNHFSCHTRLPVLLDHVVEHILETGVVASIDIFALDLDPRYLQGFCMVFLDKPRNSINHHRRAWIGYSDKLSREMARLVVCKELLHLLDNHRETAQQREQVSDLIDQVVLSEEAKRLGLPAVSDQAGWLLALAVMMPRDAIAELKEKQGKSLSPETIAKIARLPEQYVKLAFTDLWARVLESFAMQYPLEDKLNLQGGGPAVPDSTAEGGRM